MWRVLRIAVWRFFNPFLAAQPDITDRMSEVERRLSLVESAVEEIAERMPKNGK